MSHDVLIYGAGAIGSILGWLLARNYRVSVVCRSNYAYVKEHGFYLRTTTWGSGRFTPHYVFEDSSFAALRGVSYSFIVLANKIKSHQSREQMVEDLKHIVTAETVLVTTQNGLGHETTLREAFPRSPIISIVCNLVCCQVSPGVVEQKTSIKPHAFHTGIWREDSRIEYTAAESTALAALLACDDNLVAVHDVLLEKWQKLVFNHAWNSMTALTGLDTKMLLENPAAMDLVRNLAEEACRIGTASGINLEELLPDKVVRIVKMCDPIVTSTLHDAQRGRELEMTFIADFLVVQAAKLQVSVPYTEDIYRQLQSFNKSLYD